MSEKRSLVFALIVFFIAVISLILLGYGLKGLNWELIQDTAPKNLLLIFVVSVLGIGLYTLEIYFLLRSSTAVITFWKTYLVLTASMSTNYVSPLKIGIPLRVYLYNKLFQQSTCIVFELWIQFRLVGSCQSSHKRKLHVKPSILCT